MDAFTEMYLAQPPTPGVGTIVDWLSMQPFEAPAEEWPGIPVGTPPMGFYADEPSFETGELPSGETARMAAVTYYEEGGEGGSLAVYVVFYTFDSAEGRMELIDLLVEWYELPDGRYDWRRESRAGGEVAVYRRYGHDDGMAWISGPYLIKVSQGQPEYVEWVSTFADLYLSAYPPG